MKSDPECLPCLLKQAYNTAVLATADKNQQREIINRTARWIQEADLNQTPAAISTVVYRIVSEVTGIKDPYQKVKQNTNQMALDLVPDLTERMETATDPLDMALHLSVAGNIIDIGIGHDFDLNRDIQKIINTPFACNDTDVFRDDLQQGRKLLFLGDNSGEIVFDRLLLLYLLKKKLDITYVVKSGPIINDALMEDASTVGITKLVPVIETGSDDIGILWDNSSKELKTAFKDSDIILAKGHGNFESCNEMPYNFYFLLKAKCNVVAKALSVREGDIVFQNKDNKIL